MRIVYIHQYFKTPEEGGAIRSYYVSQAMKERGFDVEIISTHNQPSYAYKEIDGVSVHYLPVPYRNDYGFARRIYSFIHFVISALKLLKKIPEPDLLYITSTPLTVGYIGLRLKQKRKIPFIFEVRDLWPEAPIQMGYFKDPVTKVLLRRFERKIYLQAQTIIALSPGIQRSIARSVPAEKISLVPNMSDLGFFSPNKPSSDEITTESPFVISYIGAIGRVNHLQYLLDAAEASLAKKLPVRFIIAGQGALKSRLQRRAEKRAITNIQFTGHLSREGIRQLLHQTDAVYISFKKLPVLETNSPNKFFDALAAGKMCITNTQGWIKDIIIEHELGFYTDPERPVDFIEKIIPFLTNRRFSIDMGKNARQLGEKAFDKNELTKQICEKIQSAPQTNPNRESVYILTH